MERARTALVALLLITLAAGLLIPVYTDEVAWRFQLSRFLQDGGVDRATGESCGANQIAVPPLFMWPVRVWSSGATALIDTPFGVRATGVALAAAAALMVGVLIRRLEPAGARRTRMELLTAALLGLGVLPWLLVWSRPEQPIWLALLVAIMLAFPRTMARPGLRAAGVAAAAVVALSYHPKAVFYLPAFIALAGVAAWRERRVAVALAAIVIAAAGWSAFRYWSHRFACPDDPLLAAKVGEENLAVLILHDGWRALPAHLLLMMRAASPKLYLFIASPMPRTMSNWLPGPALPVDATVAWGAVCQVGWWAALLLGLVAAAAAMRDPARNNRRLLAALVLAGCATGWAALQLNKNVYESALYLPVLIVALLLVWSASPRADRWLGGAVWPLAMLSAASQIVLLVTQAPQLSARTAAAGFPPGQPYSVAIGPYPRAAIITAGARCGLAPRAGLRRVVTDEWTFFAYAHTQMPLFRTGVLSDWNGSIRDPLAWLHTHGSPGLVVACANLSAEARARATVSGGLCCIDTR